MDIEKVHSIKREEEISRKKFNTLGPLGVTAKDHYNIGSSAPMKLKDNPEKTYAEVLSDEELLEYLQKKETEIQENLAVLKEKMKSKALFQQIDAWAESNLRKDVENLNLTINHLKSVGRLPPQYQGFESHSLPPENDQMAMRKFLENT